MNVEERIAKLEALLALVQSRSRAKSVPPATNGTTLQAALAPAPLPTELMPPPPQAQSPLDVPTPMAGFRPSPVPPAPSPSAPPEARRSSSPKVSLRPEAPPFFLTPLRTSATAAPKPLPPPESSQVRPHEPPPMEVVELDVDPDPSLPPPSLSPPSGAEALESRSRLVSAPPVPLEGDADYEDVPDGGYDSAASDPTIEIAAAEVSRTELEAIEASEADEADEAEDASERAPTSSRRPISLEEKMSEPDDVPLHAPPPESGAIRAAVPAIDVGFEPPPPPVAVPMVAARAVQAVPAQVEVASFVGQAPAQGSPSFGELLDATLAL